MRFIYGFEEHTPENTVKFFEMLQKVFPFKIQTVQTDSGTEFTYKYISDDKECPFDTLLQKEEIVHKLIPPRTPWHNGKVERSHRNDQRYFYDWEHFISLEDFNEKLAKHLAWSNNKTMRTLARKSPVQLLQETLSTFIVPYFFWLLPLGSYLLTTQNFFIEIKTTLLTFNFNVL